MLSSAMSLTSTASLSPLPSFCSRMFLSRVVLPAPRKPDNRVTGTGKLGPAEVSEITKLVCNLHSEKKKIQGLFVR